MFGELNIIFSQFGGFIVMKRLIYTNIAILTLCIFALIGGCSPSNTVQLTYKPSDSSTLPAPGSTSIAIVQFKDERTQSHIGIRKDGTQFVTSAPVVEWLSRSLAEELAKHGYQVSFSQSIQQAKKAKPDYIVTGTVEKIWIEERSHIETSASIKASMSIYNNKGRIFQENLSSSQNLKSIPSSSTAETILQATLEEIIMPASQKIQKFISTRK